MKQIKYLVMDVDGTLTDGKIYIGENGELFKTFDVKDGYAIHSLLKKDDITPVIITGRNSKIVEKRAKELGVIDLYQGVEDKLLKLKEFLRIKSNLDNINYNLCDVAYIGDDINDLPVMQKIKDEKGMIGCPKNAIQDIKSIADFVSKYNGGEGAVREFVENIIGMNTI